MPHFVSFLISVYICVCVLCLGPLLSFEVSDTPVFEIPLSSVSQCTTGKNEVTLEFHQNDDTEVSLMEVRFYVPPTTGDEGADPVEVRQCVCVGQILFSIILF